MSTANTEQRTLEGHWIDAAMAMAFAAMREGLPAPAQDISQASYAQMIEDEFIEIRGHGLCLSATDLELIDDWFKRGVPVHVPLQALAQVEEWRRKKPEVRIRGLSYIREEVDASYAEWLESRAGAHE